MSREQRIISKLEFIEYVYEYHPQVLIEYNSRGLNQSPTADDADEQSKGQTKKCSEIS
jgi:hypothetical protein